MRIPIASGMLTLSILFFSCHQPAGGRGSTISFDGQKILGTYQGTFGTGIITIVFNYVNGSIVSGFEIHKGIRRNINGTMAENGRQLMLTLNEPGNYIMDGSFALKIDTADMTVKGAWNPFRKDQSPEKKLSLSRSALGQAEWGTNGLSEWEQAESAHRDGVLTFGEDGYCEYSFYETSGDSTRISADSTKQQQIVKGTYIYSNDVYKIEWQRNAITPAQQMTLTIKMMPIEGSEVADSTRELVGNGWVFVTSPG